MLSEIQVLTAGFVFALGAAVGSFLNVCIWRLPTDRSLMWPGSHCPRCLRPIRWYDNIPLVSYLVLRGRCRFCRAPIAARYPLVEGVTALAFLALYLWEIVIEPQTAPGANAFYRTPYGPDYWLLAAHLYVLASLIAGSIIDLEHQILPDEITKTGLVVGLAASAFVPALHAHEGRMLGIEWLDGLGWGVIGAAVGSGLTYGMAVLGKRLFRKDAMGFGDVKLMAMLGAFFGWDGAVLIFFIGPFFGLAIGIFLALKRGTRVIPYGPFLAMAAVCVMLFRSQIVNWLTTFGTAGRL
jgi:leader peptidase (prepilin peptidase)/N-methyltransferase